MYAELFRLHTQVRKQGEILELVLGLGLLDWRDSSKGTSPPIQRHMVTARVDLLFDPATGIIQLNGTADGVQLRIEDDMLDAEWRPERGQYAAVSEQLSAIDDDIWDRARTFTALKAWATVLHADCEWSPELRPAIGEVEKPRVSATAARAPSMPKAPTTCRCRPSRVSTTRRATRRPWRMSWLTGRSTASALPANLAASAGAMQATLPRSWSRAWGGFPLCRSRDHARAARRSRQLHRVMAGVSEERQACDLHRRHPCAAGRRLPARLSFSAMPTVLDRIKPSFPRRPLDYAIFSISSIWAPSGASMKATWRPLLTCSSMTCAPLLRSLAISLA